MNFPIFIDIYIIKSISKHLFNFIKNFYGVFNYYGL